MHKEMQTEVRDKIVLKIVYSYCVHAQIVRSMKRSRDAQTQGPSPPWDAWKFNSNEIK